LYMTNVKYHKPRVMKVGKMEIIKII